MSEEIDFFSIKEINLKQKDSCRDANSNSYINKNDCENSNTNEID